MMDFIFHSYSVNIPVSVKSGPFVFISHILASSEMVLATLSVVHLGCHKLLLQVNLGVVVDTGCNVMVLSLLKKGLVSSLAQIVPVVSLSEYSSLAGFSAGDLCTYLLEGAFSLFWDLDHLIWCGCNGLLLFWPSDHWRLVGHVLHIILSENTAH